MIKRIILFNIVSIVLLINIKCQTLTFDVSLVNYPKIQNEIESYVNYKINKWQQQGKYESATEYYKRVTEENRGKKIEQLVSGKINEIARQIINLEIEQMEYDPDNEVFRIKFLGLSAIYVKVPRYNHQAQSLERNKDRLQFISPQYTLTDKGFALLSMTIKNPDLDRYYRYNYRDRLTFKRKRVTVAFEPVKINIGGFSVNTSETESVVTIDREIDVDRDLPRTRMSQPNAVAIIIGNKDYQNTNPVEYAINDARSIKNYLINSLGYKEGNILYKEDITKADFEEIFGNQEYHKGRLYNMIKQNVSDVFIYYSGHGAPGLENHKGYLVPVECDPQYLEFRGYSLETLYMNLSKLPAKSVTVVMDACFSGEDVHSNISSIIPKVQNPAFSIPNGVLLSSSEATEPSCWYNDQQHGLFTYFFLRAIKDSKNSDTNGDGQLTYQEIYDYISSPTEGIPYFSRRLQAKEQHPTLQGVSSKVFIRYK